MLYLPLSLLLLFWPHSVVWAQSSTSSSSASSVSGASSASTSGITSLSSSLTASTSATPTSSAQLPSLSGASSCVSNCLDISISQVGCNSVADVNCFCGNATRFVRDITSCVSGQCVSDLASAESLAQQFCNVASPSVSLSFSSLPSTSSSSVSSTSTLSSSSASSSSSLSLTSTPSSSSASSTSSSPSSSQSGTTSAASAILGDSPKLSVALVAGLGLGILGALL